MSDLDISSRSSIDVSEYKDALARLILASMTHDEKIVQHASDPSTTLPWTHFLGEHLGFRSSPIPCAVHLWRPSSTRRPATVTYFHQSTSRMGLGGSMVLRSCLYMFNHA